MDARFFEKNVAVFAPDFFGYGERICRALDAQGALSKLIDERAELGVIGKALVRYGCRQMVAGKINRFYQACIEDLVGLDFCLVVSPELIPLEMLSCLKAKNPKCSFILYMWDSVENKPHAKNILSIFDKILSFDPIDCEDNPGWISLELFSSIDFQSLRAEKPSCDVCIIQSLHSDRYRVSHLIKEQLDQVGYSYFWFVYFRSKLLFRVKALFDSDWRTIPLDELCFKPLPYSEVVTQLACSKVILDIHHPSQRGLTMRTLEALSLGKKLITTNQYISHYHFYDPSQILIIDRNKPFVPVEFLHDGFQELPTDRFSLDKWLLAVFFEVRI